MQHRHATHRLDRSARRHEAGEREAGSWRCPFFTLVDVRADSPGFHLQLAGAAGRWPPRLPPGTSFSTRNHPGHNLVILDVCRLPHQHTPNLALFEAPRPAAERITRTTSSDIPILFFFSFFYFTGAKGETLSTSRCYNPTPPLRPPLKASIIRTLCLLDSL